MSRHVGPRRFILVRDVDPTGVSGTGMVAEGVLFSDGKVAMAWRTLTRSIVIYERLGDLERVHGHGGHTRVVWLDGPDGEGDDIPLDPQRDPPRQD